MSRFFVVVGVLLALLLNVVALPISFDFAKAKKGWAGADVEEIATTNLRLEAATTTLSGFFVASSYSGATCGNFLLDTVLPLNRCIPDVLEMTNSPYVKYTLKSNNQAQAQGFKDSSCHNSAPKAKFIQFPGGMCMASDNSPYSMLFSYSPTRPVHPEMWTTKTYGNNKCTGLAWVAQVFTTGCLPSNATSVMLSCTSTNGAMVYNTPDCTGPFSYSGAPLPLAPDDTTCTFEKPYYQLEGCSQVKPKQLPA